MIEEKKTKKERKIWVKEGSYRYLIELLKGLKREVRLLRKTLRYISVGLENQLFFDKDFIRDVACKDEVDVEILNFLRDAPLSGVLPKEIAVQCGITPWNITQRIRRMNKKLETRIGQQVAEKRGLHWCLTSFMDLSWTEDETEDSN